MYHSNAINLEANDAYIGEASQLVRIIFKMKQQQPVTMEEQALLDTWLHKDAANKRILEQMMDDRFVLDQLKAMQLWNIPAFSAALVQKVQEQQNTVKPVRRIQPWLQRVAVAAGILLFAAGTYLLLRPSSKQDKDLPASPIAKIDGASNKARLTLSDGRIIELDTLKDGSIAAVSGIQKSNDQLIYKNTGTEAVFNTLTTPRGGKFRLVLPDGSKVWMNSASSLRYPTAFTGNMRMVTLTGEAFFEIARNVKQPFSVKVQDLEVNVTGTQFNVNGYEDEGQILTTLVEGGVQVQRRQQQQFLKPGEQAIARKNDNSISVTNANIKQVVAWKDGLFIFDGKQKDEILRELSRWYDIEIEDRSGHSNVTFSGVLNRNMSLEELVELLRESNVMNGQIAGRKLIILP